MTQGEIDALQAEAAYYDQLAQEQAMQPTRFEQLPTDVQSDLHLVLFWCEHYAGADEQLAAERLAEHFGSVAP